MIDLEVERLLEAGETLLLVANQSSRRAVIGADIAERFTRPLTFRDERCVEWQVYDDHHEALEAAALSE